MPTRGSYVNSSIELALPPGTTKFAKFDVQAQTHKVLTPIRLDGQPGLIFSLCYSVGILQPLSLSPFKGSMLASADKSRLIDRYHLGGPLALRGFDLYGAGPRANSSTGGNLLTKGDSLGANRKAQICRGPFSDCRIHGRAKRDEVDRTRPSWRRTGGD